MTGWIATAYVMRRNAMKAGDCDPGLFDEKPLIHVPRLFYPAGQEIWTVTITPTTIADALEAAPAWAQLALSTRSDRLREDARLALGEHIYASLYRPAHVDRDQLALPL